MSNEIEQRLAQWDTRALEADAIRNLGLSKSQCREAIALYRQFWLLMTRYPQEMLVPPAIVDRLWHLHILDTRRYREDCQFLIGYFVDHQPHRSESEFNPTPTLENYALRTLALFEETMGAEVRARLQAWQIWLEAHDDRAALRPSADSSLSALGFAACGRCFHKMHVAANCYRQADSTMPSC